MRYQKEAFQAIKTGIEVVTHTLFLAKKLRPDDYYIERCYREAVALQIAIREIGESLSCSGPLSA